MYTVGYTLIIVIGEMHYWLLKEKHFTWLAVLGMVSKDSLKHNNPINTCLINKHLILYLTIKYLWMFGMSDLFISL